MESPTKPKTARGWMVDSFIVERDRARFEAGGVNETWDGREIA